MECWIIKFPDREVVARDKTMVVNLVRAYGKEHGRIVLIEWHHQPTESEK
jgi:hypothetical protein